MPLNDLQKQAVEYLDGPLLVLAGPGTGKTQLLSSKVEYILKNTDANPENILCLTFTESGASNMRNRLRSMIGQAAGKVNIHTYHAFGSDIIAKYKNYATSDEYDRNLDTPIDTVTQYKIIHEIQESLPPFDIMKTAKTRDIIDTISSAKSARLDSADLKAIAEDNIKITEKLNPKLDECLKNYQKGMKFNEATAKVYLPIMEVLSRYTKKDPIVVNIEREANALLLELNSIYETESAKEKPSVSPLTSWKTKHFELDENGNFRLKNRIANKKLLSLANIMAKYEEYLNASGFFDFSDMIQQAINILKTDNGFRLTLEENYQYILLDEFQDTNAAQAELIYSLTDYEKPIIMAVGDDDQAIFAFQGANASNLLDFQTHYDAKIITLVENYRSGSEILDTSYRIREQIVESFAKSKSILKKLTAAKVRTADISRHEFLESSAEYNWIASEIHSLIKSGVPQSEIAVITPKHKYVLPLLPYLKSYSDINISYEKRDNVFEDQRIHELLTLSDFIYKLSKNEQPVHLFLEILSFPFWEIPMLTVIQAIQRKSGEKQTTLDYLLSSNDEKLKSAATLLSELVRVSFNAPLEIFIDYLIGATDIKLADGKTIRSNFLSYYSKSETSYDTFGLYENLSVLRAAIKAHNNNSGVLKLEDLINFVNDYETAEEALLNTSPYQESNDSIQILTAHKSKGLEFEYVFIIATDDRSWGNAKGNNNFLSLPPNLASIRHTGITEDERLRLFFVAITRAKKHLIMTNSVKDFDDKSPARLEYLAEYEKDDTIISPFLPEDSKIVIKHYENLPEDQKKSNLKAHWLSNYQHLDGNLKDILLKRLENYKLSATDITTFIDIAYAGPMAFYHQKVLCAPDETYSKALTFGNLVHATFEQVTNANLSDDDAISFFKEQVAGAPIPPEDLEYIIEKGEASLRSSLKKFGNILRAKNAKAEVNFYHEHISLNNIPLTGKIDHININEEDKTIEIYDFKTSGFKDKKWNSHPTLYKYRLQLGFYKLLLNLSPTYGKYKIEKAHILFVVPDDDLAVHDKIYEYTEKEEEELKAMIAAVYAHIKTLDFLENPELALSPNSEKGIKDILEFIKLLLDTAPNI